MQPPVITVFGERRFVLFFNPNEDNGCLSNWYEAPFDIDGREFTNLEQAFVYLKAMHFNDAATANRVFAMHDPLYLQRLNRQIMPYDRREWLSVRESVMRRCVSEKFSQNDELKTFLASTGDSIIAACSSRDRYWGNGCDPMSLSRLIPDEWPGQNVLGGILMDLRKALGEEDGEDDKDTSQDVSAALEAPEAPSDEQDVRQEEPAEDTEATEPDEPAEEAEAEPEPEDIETDADAHGDSEDPGSPSPAGTPEEATEPEETPEPASTSDAGQDEKAPDAAEVSAPTDSVESDSSDGTRLKSLVEDYLARLTVADLDRLVDAFRDAKVVVPVTYADADQDESLDPEARFFSEYGGRRLRPNVVENERGQRWFAVFTSAGEIPAEARKGADVISMPMTDCVEMARTRGDTLGIIVNAFSDCLTLTPETCLRIASIPPKLS